MRASTSTLFLAVISGATAQSVSLVIDPVPSYIPSIPVVPPPVETSAPPGLLTIIPQPDLLPASSVEVILPPVSTLEPIDEISAVQEPLSTTWTTVDGAKSTTTIPGVPVTTPSNGPVSTSTSTTTSYFTPTTSTKPTSTGKTNGTGPIETSGSEGRDAGYVFRNMLLALGGVMGVFLFA